MTNKFTALAFISIFLLFLLFGCSISKNQNMGCCKYEDAQAGADGICTLVNEKGIPIKDVNDDAYSDIIQHGCVPDETDATKILYCKVELKINEITKPYNIPICSNPPPETACYDASCTAMFCGPLQYQAKIPVSDSEVKDSASKGERLNIDTQSSGLPAGTLAESTCIFTKIDDTFKNLIKNSKDSFVNTFRIGYFDSTPIEGDGSGPGDLYQGYSLVKYKFPLTDQFCAALPYAQVDRFTNYLVPPDRVCEFGIGYLMSNEQLDILEGRLKNEMDKYWEASSCLNINELPAYLQTNQYCEGSNSEYCKDGNYVTKPNGEIDVEFYKNMLHLTYLPFIQNEKKAPFECYSSADCKSGFCSKDDYSRSGCMTNEGTLVGCLCEDRQSRFGEYVEQVTLCRTLGETVTNVPADVCNAENYNYDFVTDDLGFGGHELVGTLCTIKDGGAGGVACSQRSQAEAVHQFFSESIVGGAAEDSVFRTEMFPITQIVIKDNYGFSVLDADEFKHSALVTTCGLEEGRDYKIYNFAGWLLTHPNLKRDEAVYSALPFEKNPDGSYKLDAALKQISDQVPEQWRNNIDIGDGKNMNRHHYNNYWTLATGISTTFLCPQGVCFVESVSIPMYYIKITKLGNCRPFPGEKIRPEVTEYGWCAPCSYLAAVNNAGAPLHGAGDANDLPEDNPSRIFEDKTERYLKEGTMSFINLSSFTLAQTKTFLSDFDNYGAAALIVGAVDEINKDQLTPASILDKTNLINAETGCLNCLTALQFSKYESLTPPQIVKKADGTIEYTSSANAQHVTISKDEAPIFFSNLPKGPQVRVVQDNLVEYVGNPSEKDITIFENGVQIYPAGAAPPDKIQVLPDGTIRYDSTQCIGDYEPGHGKHITFEDAINCDSPLSVRIVEDEHTYYTSTMATVVSDQGLSVEHRYYTCDPTLQLQETHPAGTTNMNGNIYHIFDIILPLPAGVNLFEMDGTEIVDPMWMGFSAIKMKYAGSSEEHHIQIYENNNLYYDSAPQDSLRVETLPDGRIRYRVNPYDLSVTIKENDNTVFMSTIPYPDEVILQADGNIRYSGAGAGLVISENFQEIYPSALFSASGSIQGALGLVEEYFGSDCKNLDPATCNVQLYSAIDLIGVDVPFNGFLQDFNEVNCDDPTARTELYDNIIDALTNTGSQILLKTGKPSYLRLTGTHIAPNTPCFQYVDGKNEFQEFMNRVMFSQYKFAQSGTMVLFLDSYKYGITESNGAADADFSCSLQKSTRLSVNKVPNFMYKRLNEVPAGTGRAKCVPCTPADLMLGKCNQPSARICVGGNSCIEDPAAGDLQKCMDDTVVGACKLCSDPRVKDITYDCTITYIDGKSDTKTYTLEQMSDKTRDILAAIPPEERCCLEPSAVPVPEGEDGQPVELPIPYTYAKIDIGVTLKSPMIYSPEDPSKTCPAANDFGKVLLENNEDMPMCSADLNEGLFKTIFDTYTVTCKRS